MKTAKILTVIAAAGMLLVAGVNTAYAQVNGAIYTTTSTGTTVDGNIYAAKPDVYLSGGPQNKNNPGLVPDGLYYFQVTDPSGALLLSTDDITCRQVVVSGGRVVGVPPGSPPAGCTTGYHAIGTQNDFNGALPVQLIPYNDTPNPGGEYKAWMTPVADYGEACAPNHVSNGFCDNDSKTDNFKVKKAGVAYVTVCKFNDQNNDGIQQTTEPLIPHWPITATGVDGGTVAAQTDDLGCVSFTVSGSTFTGATQTVTLTEGTQGPDWTQTAPSNGTCTLTGTVNASDTCAVTGGTSSTPPSAGGVISVAVSPGDDVHAPNFGNFNPLCTTGCSGNQVVVTKDANPIVKYTWSIKKSVDKTEIDTAPGGNTTFNYTVDVSHDSGTATMTGTITVANATGADITNVTVADSVSDSAAPDGGVCTVESGAFHDGTGTVSAGSHVDVHYSCTFTNVPPAGSNTNTATATWDGGLAVGTADFDFSGVKTVITDGSVTVTDPLSSVNPLGTASYTDANPKEFKYSNTVTGKSGTCVTVPNTATFTTNTTGTTGSDSQSVKVCEGADLTVYKTATASFSSSISKSVDKTKVEQSGGSITFKYTVTVAESAWTVAGNITVKNPNDWESITTSVTDSIDGGGSCTVTGGVGVVLTAGSSAVLPYTCTYSSRPTLVSGTNTATATWNAALAFTTDGSASGTKGYTFNTLTITDNVQSSAYPGPTGCNATLGTVSVTTTTPSGSPGCGLLSLASSTWGVFTYSITDTNASPGACVSYNNTAQITGGTSSSQVTVTVCNTNTGALTMGFWKNPNGQGIIKSYCAPAGGTSLGAFLTQFNPYKDDTAGTNCNSQATYVSNIISGATCTSSTSTCNSMLRAQMLSTALDVYFSTPGLGGNKIGAYNGLGSSTPALGGIVIDLSHICSMADTSSGSTCTGVYEDSRPEFGIVSTGGCLGTTVGNMLAYTNFPSAVNGNPVATANTGASWYVQIKGKQVYAKDGFDDINNVIANIATTPPTCSPSF